MQIRYIEANMQDVINYFVNGYNYDIFNLVHYESFVDVQKGKIIFKLLLEEKPKEITNEQEVSE